MRANPYVGWYESADQPVDQPSHNPPDDAPCPICLAPITPDDIRTISIMESGANKSWFYRAHRTCHEELDDELRIALDALVFPFLRRKP